MTPRTESSWVAEARADLRSEGPRCFWLGWRRREDLRAAAYALGRFTPAATAVMDRYQVVQVPSGVAWTGAVLAVALATPALARWFPRLGALPRTPWVGAACLHPLPWVAGVRAALTPYVVAHEFAHLIWPRLDHDLRHAFPAVLQALERDDPTLTAHLDDILAHYKDPRSPDECHVRLLERYEYGRRVLPATLEPYYAGWVEV